MRHQWALPLASSTSRSVGAVSPEGRRVYCNHTATGPVQSGAQRTKRTLEASESSANHANHRTHQHGLERSSWDF